MTQKFEREGFWWAKWLKADPGTQDDGECCAGDASPFEPVEVFANCTDPDSEEPWRVHVLGVEKSQSIANFEWGEPVATRKSV